MAKYNDVFNKYLAKSKFSKIQEASYQSIKSAAHDMETALYSVYVPKAWKLLLDIRKNEKDYLLMDDKKYVKATHNTIVKLSETFRGNRVLQVHINDVNTDLTG